MHQRVRVRSTATVSSRHVGDRAAGRAGRTLREAGLVGELAEHHRGARVALARLHHERVAAHDRHREHPERDHRREVEGRDARRHAERRADRVRVHVARDAREVLAEPERRDAAAVLHHLCTSAQAQAQPVRTTNSGICSRQG